MTPSNPAPVGDEREARKSGEPSDAELAAVAYKGFDDYWTEDCAGKDSEAWAASAKAVLARFGTRPAAEPATETYVQPVPDHCDRITWRNRYYSLPLAAEPIQSGSAGEAILGAVSRGWGHPKNAHKEMDVDLAEAIADEVAALSRQAPAAPAEAKECRHCGWLCSPNAAPKRDWYPLAAPIPAEPAKTEAAAVICPRADGSKRAQVLRAGEDLPLGTALYALSTPPTPEAEPVQQDTNPISDASGL